MVGGQAVEKNRLKKPWGSQNVASYGISLMPVITNFLSDPPKMQVPKKVFLLILFY